MPFCGVAGEAHKPADCPSWCAEDHHHLPFDRSHDGENHEVELDAHPYQDLVNGEWRTWRQPLVVGLTKEPSSKPAYIEIIGVDEKLAGRLTAYEAEQLADILRRLAAILRHEEAERLAGTFAQAAANGYSSASAPSR